MADRHRPGLLTPLTNGANSYLMSYEFGAAKGLGFLARPDQNRPTLN